MNKQEIGRLAEHAQRLDERFAAGRRGLRQEQATAAITTPSTAEKIKASLPSLSALRSMRQPLRL